MGFSPSPVSRPREQIEMQIREAILSGKLQRGDRLPSETALAKQFSVSRTTVREALRALASGGLIEKLPGVAGGSFVKSVDHRSMGSALGESLDNILRLGSVSSLEVQQLRRLLEVPAAGLAAAHRTDEQIAVIDAILGEEKGAEVDDPVVADLDIGFHSAVGEATGNRPLAAFIAALHSVARPVDSLKLDEAAGKATVRQHLKIVHEIQARRREGAEAAMSDHLDFIEGLTS
jgi:DNA-binding FadR family transcriptional regulator